MSNFVGIPPQFFCNFSIIACLLLIVINANYLHVEPLGRMIVFWYQLGTMHVHVGKLVAEI